MISDEIRNELFALQDKKYRDFQLSLIPGKTAGELIGVRTPALKAIAKKYSSRADAGDFLSDLPHSFFEEDQIHSFIISGTKDFVECVRVTEIFLPFVDNWATCDQLSPASFSKHSKDLLPHIRAWLASGRTYTVRFAIGMLMRHFLDADFDAKYPDAVASVRSGEYYVNMMIAWYFATALAKQYDAVLSFMTERRLDPWTHNKAIQKAIESRRITPERKEFLLGLKIPVPRH